MSLMACFADINVSHGSVATYARCGGIFDIHFTASLHRNLSVKTILNRLRIDRIMVMSLGPTCILCMIRYDTRCYFNVRSKADMSRLNLPHADDN